MPYNPGASYQGGQFIANGRSNLINAVLQLVGGLTEQSRQAKEYRTLLADVDPANSDQYKKMSLGELQGAYQAKEYQSKADAAKLLAQEAQQRIAAAQRKASGEAEIGPFLKAWQGNMQPIPPVTSAGAPAAGPPAPGMGSLQAALSAGGQYPLGAEASGFQRYLPALIRESDAGPGAIDLTPQPWLAGGLSGVVEPKTGKTMFDVETERKIAEARRNPNAGAGHTNTPTLPPGGKRVPAKDSEGKPITGLYDILDSKGNVVGSWSNPHTTKSGLLDDLGASGGAAQFTTADDVIAAYKSGKVGRDDALRILQQQFNYAP